MENKRQAYITLLGKSVYTIKLMCAAAYPKQYTLLRSFVRSFALTTTCNQLAINLHIVFLPRLLSCSLHGDASMTNRRRTHARRVRRSLARLLAYNACTFVVEWQQTTPLQKL